MFFTGRRESERHLIRNKKHKSFRGMIANANKNATAVELHAGCFYVVDPNGPATLPGTTIRIRVVDMDTPGAQHYSNMDAMYDEAERAVGTVPVINP